MESSKIIDTLVATATRLDIDEPGSPVNETMYRGIIGSLLYLTGSRSDIVFSMGLCARFQSNPKESHLKVAKRILRYLKGTQDMVLYYPSGDNFDLIGYVDADYAGYLVDRKSTSDMAHFLAARRFRDNVVKGLICVKFCSIEDQIVDIFTKALSREIFLKNCKAL
ncbi:secreted RxLR effector protein 161-like [Nicotiana tomentosiformis]|uniref:secreted RxLR effector protein 161-like n=1 Tax=Nicotiana tomentosiformis TaxID=4098 RepID=UPI00388C600B